MKNITQQQALNLSVILPAAFGFGGIGWRYLDEPYSDGWWDHYLSARRN